jgi:hypothetical protein
VKCDKCGKVIDGGKEELRKQKGIPLLLNR